jgi:hypothetical protein
VKRLGAAAVPRADGGAGVQQHPDDRGPVAGGGNVQRSIAGIQVMADLIEVIRTSLLSRRTPLGASGGQIGRRRQQLRYRSGVVGHDGPDQR